MVDAAGMSVTAVDEVLVGPLRADDRRRDLLSRLELLPQPWQVVLRGCYLQGRPEDEVADECHLTLAELGRVKSEALAALARSRVRTVRRAVLTPYG